MCCFTGPVESVANTNIFARALEGGRQVLVYQMRFAADEELAMVLPIPTPAGSSEDAVEFVDLSEHEDFFTRVRSGFPVDFVYMTRGMAMDSNAVPEKTLVVKEVGEFEASFVPSLSDFERLDERFRIAPDIWKKLPDYQDWGFAVFKLRAPEEKSLLKRLFSRQRERKVHPMAFRFPTRAEGKLFFPTVHIHDGEFYSHAKFDHNLYCQPDPITQATFRWPRSEKPAGELFEASSCPELLDPNEHIFRWRLRGRGLNVDWWVFPPTLSSVDKLKTEGEYFAIDWDFSCHHAEVLEREAPEAALRRQTARFHADELIDQWTAGLESLLAQKVDDWALAPIADAPHDFEFKLFRKDIDFQTSRIGFAELPSEELRSSIFDALYQVFNQIEFRTPRK